MSETDQHYVPQLLLRGFAHGKRKQLYAFDKRDERIFRSSVRNLACERGFYEPAEQKGLSNVDSWMERAETEVAPLIQRIREQKSISWLLPAQRKWLSAFVMIQILRTPSHREMWSDFNRQMTELIRESGADPYKVENFRPLTDSELRDSSIAQIRELAVELCPHILAKSWLLLECSEDYTFWVSDNPVVITNTINPGDGIRGTLGLRVRGIEIYLPISHPLTLGFLCPTAEQMVKSGVQTATMFNLAIPETIPELDVAFAGNHPFRIDSDNVTFQNSLQVSRSERYIYSPFNDFRLAEDMIRENPEIREGPRLGFAGRTGDLSSLSGSGSRQKM